MTTATSIGIYGWSYPGNATSIGLFGWYDVPDSTVTQEPSRLRSVAAITPDGRDPVMIRRAFQKLNVLLSAHHVDIETLEERADEIDSLLAILNSQQVVIQDLLDRVRILENAHGDYLESEGGSGIVLHYLKTESGVPLELENGCTLELEGWPQEPYLVLEDSEMLMLEDGTLCETEG